MKYKKEELKELAKKVSQDFNHPQIQTGLLMLAMVTGKSIEECKLNIIKMSAGEYNED